MFLFLFLSLSLFFTASKNVREAFGASIYVVCMFISFRKNSFIFVLFYFLEPRERARIHGGEVKK